MLEQHSSDGEQRQTDVEREEKMKKKKREEDSNNGLDFVDAFGGELLGGLVVDLGGLIQLGQRNRNLHACVDRHLCHTTPISIPQQPWLQPTHRQTGRQRDVLARILTEQVLAR